MARFDVTLYLSSTSAEGAQSNGRYAAAAARSHVEAENPRKSKCKEKIGGGCANVHEPVDLTVSCVYQVSWELQSLDLTELAKLRWIERWRIERIAEHFGYSRSGIKGALRKIEADPDRASIELGYRKKRPWAIASRSFRGK